MKEDASKMSVYFEHIYGRRERGKSDSFLFEIEKKREGLLLSVCNRCFLFEYTMMQTTDY